MPRKKISGKTTKTVRAAKTTKATKVKKVVATQKTQTAVSKFVEYLRLGESYTSLILGIIAVIIATVLLLSIFHNRQSGRQTPEVTPTIAQSGSFAISPTGVSIKQPEGVAAPAAQPKLSQTQTVSGKTYTVIAGDNLWVIAEKIYKNGYNWVDIAKANHLADPSDIHVGNKLIIPQVSSMIATVQTADENMATSTTKITDATYRIVPGDDLWDIAVRAYGDGYQWVKIAKVNNLSNPGLIHVGNVLKIPRN